MQKKCYADCKILVSREMRELQEGQPLYMFADLLEELAFVPHTTEGDEPALIWKMPITMLKALRVFLKSCGVEEEATVYITGNDIPLTFKADL